MRVAVAAVFLLGATAHASGPELVGQGPEGVAVAGAQAADVAAPAAAYYNPAALAFQPGLTLQAGGAAVVAGASYQAGGAASDGSASFGVPAVFAGQRVAARYAVGLGVYEAFAWSVRWPPGFAARAGGTGFEWRAVAVNPSIAVRPRGWFALGLGVDIVPTTIALDRAIGDGGSEAARRIDAGGTGLGGNAGLLFHAWPRRLDLAVTYRSAMRIGLSGTARTVAPPESTGSLAPFATATGTLATPHALTVALAAHPVAALTLTADVRVVLWHDLSSLTFTLADQAKQLPAAQDVSRLGFRDTAELRAGAQYGLWRDGDGNARLTLRAGGGFVQSPADAGAPSPLVADGNRAVVAAGAGARLGAFSVDAGWSVAISGVGGGYREVTHVVSAALTVRLPDLGYHVDEPDFRR